MGSMTRASPAPRSARTGRCAVALVGAAVFLPAAAMADDTRVAAVDDRGPPGQTAAAPVPTVAPALAPALVPAERPADAEPTPLEQRRAIANSGRGLVGHTALTVPQGRVEISMRGLVPYAGLATIAAGLGPTTELSADVGGVLVDTPAAVLGAGVKQVLVQGDRVQVSVGGSVRRIHDPDANGILLAQLGGTLSACADRQCSLLVSAGLSGVYAREEDATLPVVSLGISAGSRYTRLLGEVFVIERAAIVFGGLRFGNATFTGDVGLMTAVLDETGVLPFAGFGTRM